MEKSNGCPAKGRADKQRGEDDWKREARVGREAVGTAWGGGVRGRAAVG